MISEIKSKNNNLKIVSIDIPSGWDVNEGKKESNFNPDMNVSLTLPKLGIIEYDGIHYLGGRFVPKKLYEEMILKNPLYDKGQLVIKIPKF